MPLTYREITVDDIPAVFHVRVSTVENAITAAELEAGYGVTPASLAGALRGPVRGWLCEDDGAVVGFAMGDRETGEVGVVAVLPSHERRGIGIAVLSRVRDWLFSEGHDRVWLKANPDTGIRATGFYASQGWEPTGEKAGDDIVLTLHRQTSG